MAALARVASMPRTVSRRSERLCGVCCPRFPSNLIASKPDLHSPWVLGGGRRFPGCRVDAFNHASQVTTTGEYIFSGLHIVSKLPTGIPDPSNRQPRKEPLATLVEPVADDLHILNNKLRAIIPAENPLLMAAAEQNLGSGEKRLRPALVFLVSRATSQPAGLEEMTPGCWDLAIVLEMIFTASLIHHDLLEKSETGRGKVKVHSIFGSRGAVLAGDFMFAQSSWYLAKVDNLEVIKLINTVMKDFASGEIKHGMSWFECDISVYDYVNKNPSKNASFLDDYFMELAYSNVPVCDISLDDYLEKTSSKSDSLVEDYLEKNSYKNASLIAASTQSAAMLSEASTNVCDQMYNYGLHLGMALQVIDEILEFCQSSEQLGKRAGSNLAKGNLTIPVLFALQSQPRLRELISTKFKEEGSLDAAIYLVSRGRGIEKARQLAQKKGNLALKNLECLPQSPFRHSLERIVDYVLHRVD